MAATIHSVAFTSQRVWYFRNFRWFVLCLAVGLALIPIVNMARLLTTTGADNLGNDYVAIIGLLDSVLSGSYNWANYFRDSFLVGSHSMAIPTAIMLGVARFANMSEYVMIYISIFLVILRLILLYDILTYWTKHWLKFLLLPILSLFLFANSQVSVFGFSQAGLQIHTSLLGFTFGLWGAIHFPGRWFGVWIVVTGGLVAAWSGGYGVIAWPFLLLSMLLFKFRRPQQYLLWFFIAVIAALPYISFRLLTGGAAHSAGVDLFRLPYFLELIGLPFAPILQQNSLRVAGALGVFLLVPSLILVWQQRHTSIVKYTIPSLILLGYSLSAIYQITIFRDSPAPWYTTISLLYWVSILGLNVAFFLPSASHQSTRSIMYRVVWGSGVILLLFALYFGTNIEYLDKSMYLWMRRPVSASCMLYYRSAPTYCEGYIYQWGVGRPILINGLAEPLERHQISTFAPHQIWTLQGDFGLNNVRIQKGPGVPNIFWSLDEGTAVRRNSWDDFRHLNLFLHTPNEVSWTVHLPPNIRQAEFHSGVAISESVAPESGGDGLTAIVALQIDAGSRENIYTQRISPHQQSWQPITIPLHQYAGHQITLYLSSEMLSNYSYDWAMFQYPYIEVEFDTTRGDTSAELNLNEFTPPLTPADLRFDLAQWQMRDINAGDVPNTWQLEGDEAVAYTITDLCLSDYEYIYIRLSASEMATQQRYAQITFVAEQLGGWEEEALRETLVESRGRLVQIPLHAGSGMHDYYYPIRLFESDDPTSVSGFSIMPLVGGNAEVVIEDFRLIRREDANSSLCVAP